MTNARPTIIIDRRRAQAVLPILLALYTENRFPYDRLEHVLPQAKLPKSITQDPLVHSCFLFFLNHFMRGRIDSGFATRELIKLHTDHPDIFDPAIVCLYQVAELRDLFNRQFALVPDDEIPAAWIENARRLNQFWGGDPRNIFKGTKSAKVIRKRIMNKKTKGAVHKLSGFVGFQEKMASMLAYFLMDAGLIKRFVIAPPVDFHLMRIMIHTGILILPLPMMAPRRVVWAGIEVLEWYCRRYQADPVAIADVLWCLSKELCAKAPGEIETWTEAVARQYHRQCGHCPLEADCTLYVPSGQYYGRGDPQKRRGLKVTARTRPPVELAAHPDFFGSATLQRGPKKPKAAATGSIQATAHPDLFDD